MFKGRYVYTTTLSSDLEHVWLFFQSAENLVRITRFPLVSIDSDPTVAQGKNIKLKLNFILFRLKWLLKIKEVEEKVFFIDEGLHVPFPFKKWQHIHSFSQKGNQTVMTDEIEFEAYLPAFIIRILLFGMFRDRGKVIQRYFE